MALRQSTKTYLDACDVPTCMCADAEVVFFLKDDLLTLSGKAYVDGTVVSVTELSTGAVQVVIQYDDADLPDVDGEKLEVIFPGVVAEGTVCDPDCAGECSWVKKAKALGSESEPVFYLERQIYGASNWVADGQFSTPRIALTPGLRLTAVRLTCHQYDAGTSLTLNLKVGATIHAQYVGNLSAQKGATILVADLPNDVLPEVEITGVTYANYATAAKGLIVTMIGTTMP
jgi:hypothetical protein